MTETTLVPICEVTIGGTITVSAALDPATVRLADAFGIDPVPLALHRLADDLEAKRVSGA